MTNEIYCSAATVATNIDPSQVPDLVVPAPPSDLAALIRQYRSVRSAVVVQAMKAWLQRAGSDLPDPDRRGIALGTATGAGPDIEEFLDESIRLGDHLVNPAKFPMTVHNAAAGNAAIAAHCRGPNIVVSEGIHSVWSALTAAHALLHDNSADIMFVGGFESQRLANGSTGTIAAFIALSAGTAIFGENRIASPNTRSHWAGVLPRPQGHADSPEDPHPCEVGAASVMALVKFANTFAPAHGGAAAMGVVDESEAVAR
ncbi:beta-ketoacyl synthase chain length factor [Amycolatopsis sp. NPDC059021]|uniref:beta-ketoacyl synthase chain length factor n=1 Tax=Amycolatopsis sp. NPDC059021 TaxID=3346704 RepID=UPI00366CBD61